MTRNVISMLQRHRRASPAQRIAAAIMLLAFAVLASVAASHLHVGANQDEFCSVCAAFGAGKLERTSPGISVPPPVALTSFRQEYESVSQVPRSNPVVLPPGCGPPGIA